MCSTKVFHSVSRQIRSALQIHVLLNTVQDVTLDVFGRVVFPDVACIRNGLISLRKHRHANLETSHVSNT